MIDLLTTYHLLNILCQACAEREEQYRPKLLVKPAERKPVPPPAPPPAEPQTPELPQSHSELHPPLPSSPIGGMRMGAPDSGSDSDGGISDAPPEPMGPDMEENSPSRGEYPTLYLCTFTIFLPFLPTTLLYREGTFL